jgi:hypothetical protein
LTRSHPDTPSGLHDDDVFKEEQVDSTTRLTLIQQNDTHAQMEPHWEHFWRNGRPEYRHAGGYARAATIVRRIKEETDGSAILVDCGDTLHGTGPAQWTQGAAVVPALNAMGVELMTPGNWEFGFGPDVLRERAAEMAFPLIACNVERAATSEAEFPPLRGARDRRDAGWFCRRHVADRPADDAQGVRRGPSFLRRDRIDATIHRGSPA